MNIGWRDVGERRRVAAAVYLALGVANLAMAWASMNVVVLAVGLAFVPLAMWAWRSYPVSRDW